MDFVKEPTLLGVVVLLSVIILKLVEFIMAKFLKKSSDRPTSEKIKSVLTPEEAHLLKELYEMHNVKDENGVPMMFVPRDIAETQKDVIRSLAQISMMQEKTAYILESMVKSIDRLSDKIDRCPKN